MKKKAPAPDTPQAEPCYTCGPGEVRASHFPSTLRLWEQRKGGVADPASEAHDALVKVSDSVLWLMIEDLVEQRRDEFLATSLEAVSAEATAACVFRAQGAEVVLRLLRSLRVQRMAEKAQETT